MRKRKNEKQVIKSVIPNFFKILNFTKISSSENKDKNSNKRYKNNLFRYCFILLD